MADNVSLFTDGRSVGRCSRKLSALGGTDGIHEDQFTVLRHDGDVFVTMERDKMADVIEQTVFGPHLQYMTQECFRKAFLHSRGINQIKIFHNSKTELPLQFD